VNVALVLAVARDPAKLQVFQLAHRLVLDVYRVSSALPRAEQFGLQAQLRRAAVSVPANIVEGCSRRSDREYERFVDIALGSAVELRYLLQLTRDLGFLQGSGLAECQECSDHVVRALHSLQRAVALFSS
jgi:four helix bundle protein